MSHAPTRRQVVFVAAALLLSPLLTLYATQAVWLQNLLTPFSWMASHLPASGLFWLLFFSLMLPLYGLTRRLFIAYLPGTGFCMTLAIISRYKMDINGAPLQLSDFTFVGNLGDIAGFASDMLAPTLTVVVSVIVCILWTVLLAVLEKWHPSGTVGFLAIALSLALLLSAAYPGTLQEAAMTLDQTCQDQEDRSQELGVMLGLYAALAHRIETEHGTGDPDITDLVAQFREEANQPGTPAGENAPDIIFLTSESFFDITRLPGLTFSEDPLPNFHRLAETCTDGLFISDTYGGGTGHVEMEMFTGLTSSLLREGDTLNTLSLSVYQDLPTTARLLKNAGYSTVALHSHTDELYNRANVLPRIGFDTVAFREDFMTEGAEDGAYLSDASLVQEMIARYESRDPSKPIFLYAVDFAAIGVYLLYIDLTTGGGWFFSFALPVTGAAMVLVTAVVTLLRYVPSGALYTLGGGLILAGGFNVLVEFLLNLTFHLHDTFLWSFYPLAVCVVLGAMLLVIAACKPLRRSLHKKFFI